MRLSPPQPTTDNPSVPIISNNSTTPTYFSLHNGTLVVDGFTAHEQPSISTFPPPLNGFEFGGDGPASPLKFFPTFSCNAHDELITQLALVYTNSSMSDFSHLVLVLVPSVARVTSGLLRLLIACS